MLGYKLEYLAQLMAWGSFALFVRTLYPQEMNRWACWAILLFCSGYGMFVGLTHPHIFSYTMLFFQFVIITSFFYLIYVFISAVINRRRGAAFHILGFSVLSVALMFDILFYNQVVSGQPLLYYGMFFYIFMQALHLSVLFAESYTRIEDLSGQLRLLNTNLDEKVKSRTRELREKNEDLNHMQTLRSQLLMNISHELGTPLTSIRGYVKGMLDGVFPRGDDKYMQLVYDKTLLLDHFIGDLHDLSKLENRQLSFIFQDENICLFLQHLYEEYEPEISKSGRTFIYNDALNDEYAVAQIDTIRMEQVFSNILSNARKHTPKNGAITVKLEKEKANAVISIIDSGDGIEEDMIPFIFDRFYQSTSSNGFGIGLAICKEIIEQHNGAIGVQSELGVGSRFYFKLPLQ
ncbi:HAMP domain-containing histidine kinase [Salicibibacter cibi]|uniref:histidine kinase n=1 Tax=Salicibibacter cibi TaxID=2743001 RepID=A0A7T6ZDZ7_9BACI|nr:HAMP domain-containing sensor histidine kinase [Salicibibacter cibi]QQK81637.1 HAMP domain-containing histidine kinase [Salicibibacter cibi]